MSKGPVKRRQAFLGREFLGAPQTTKGLKEFISFIAKFVVLEKKTKALSFAIFVELGFRGYCVKKTKNYLTKSEKYVTSFCSPQFAGC